LLYFKFGANESSGEFGENELPGTYNKDYIYPNVDAIEALREQGMNAFRVCNRWERLQHELYGELNEFDKIEFKLVIDYITSKGSIAIIDPHNYARYNNKLIGSNDVPIDAFVDFWTRLAELFKDNENVWFGLVNEPHDIDTDDWFKAARAAVDGIRSTGAKNNILIPGNGWTGAWSWGKEAFYGESNADVALKYFSSEDENILFEVHQYFDEDKSGTHEECVQRPCQNNFKEFIEWLKTNNLKGFVGEIGSFLNDECKECIQEAVEYLQENREYIVGTLWWAAGPWWGQNAMSIEPNSEKAFPGQMAWLKPYLPGPSDLTEVPVFINEKVYCTGCEVTATGSDNSYWGWENEKSCEIDKVTCGFTTESPRDNTDDDIPASEDGYCKGCEITATGDDGSLWGWENETSCRINNEACGIATEEIVDDNEDIPDSEDGYCRGCEITATGDDGSLWGWENETSCRIHNEACGIAIEEIVDDNEDIPVSEDGYCRGCEITATGGDGSLWGWENEISCRINNEACGIAIEEIVGNNDDTSTSDDGYCRGCEITATGDDGSLWGWENETSCRINNEACGIAIEEIVGDNDDTSTSEYGYCKGCEITATRDDGSLWGWENEKSCQINKNACGLNSNNTNNNDNGTSSSIYCNGCEVTATGGDGSLWGWENEKSCQINNKACGFDSNETTNDDDNASSGVYCNGCQVTATGSDESLWGWENEKSCQIDKIACNIEVESTINSSSCKFLALGYQCCSHCYYIYEDDNGYWGVEKNQWCGIPDRCNNKNEKCWSAKYGYPCCKDCNVYLKDKYGSWGVLDNDWCGIPDSCNTK